MMERKDSGRAGTVESATVEHVVAVRAWRCGHDTTVKRKVRADIFVFL
jgi:hypothetical protein